MVRLKPTPSHYSCGKLLQAFIFVALPCSLTSEDTGVPRLPLHHFGQDDNPREFSFQIQAEQPSPEQLSPEQFSPLLAHLYETYNIQRTLEYYDDDAIDDKTSNADKRCSKYLRSFFEGITDAKDQCEGVQNAYTGAYCGDVVSASTNYEDDDHDDYFTKNNYFSCCESLRYSFDKYCEEGQIITNMHLLLIAAVLLCCEMAKSLIKSHHLHFLPEAGGCVLVGVFVGLITNFVPFFVSVDDLSFDEELFIIILLPPIIFEAALSVNKKEFRRRRLAILMFAVFGTILSTFMTGYMVFYSSHLIESATSIPLIDSLIFGALISSIDPVAILSVLTSLNMTEQDTVFIMVFGESLLNDGVAITLFRALITQFNRDESVTADDILGAIADFLIVSFGSIAIGLGCGILCLLYFWFLRNKLNSAMEVASFFLWAGIPYYICDEYNLSGIVAIVTVGFFMDIYIATPKGGPHPTSSSVRQINNTSGFARDNYVDLGDSMPCSTDVLCGGASSPSGKSLYSFKSLRSLRSLHVKELILQEERFRLSSEAEKHVRFVAHLLAQLSENAIFVYLGLFLFSKKIEWEFALVAISICSCILSRGLMVMIICFLVWHINVMRQRCGCYVPQNHSFDADEPQVSRTAKALQERKIQAVLVLAGLRGAVSLALMESVPLYNGVTGEGSEFKPEMKAMTNAAIIFTVFVFGGSAYYILRRLGISSDLTNQEESNSSTTIAVLPIKNKAEFMKKPRPESPLKSQFVPEIN